MRAFRTVVAVACALTAVLGTPVMAGDDAQAKNQNVIERIEHGDRVFPFTETADAGVMDDLDIDFQDVLDGNGVVITAGRFFGTRNNQIRDAAS